MKTQLLVIAESVAIAGACFFQFACSYAGKQTSP
jgi:hypothetical protein